MLRVSFSPFSLHAWQPDVAPWRPPLPFSVSTVRPENIPLHGVLRPHNPPPLAVAADGGGGAVGGDNDDDDAW